MTHPSTRFGLALLAGLALCAPPGSLFAQDASKTPPSPIAGKWVGHMENGSPGHDITLDLQADGKKVTGTFTALGKLPLQGEFAGDKLTFTVKVKLAGGEEGTMTFRATLKDGVLQGTMTPFGGDGEFAWTASKTK